MDYFVPSIPFKQFAVLQRFAFIPLLHCFCFSLFGGRVLNVGSTLPVYGMKNEGYFRIQNFETNAPGDSQCACTPPHIFEAKTNRGVSLPLALSKRYCIGML
jgi:hypothetical protein